MRDLIKDPAWRPSDLGQPIPDSPYAVSVAMPLWRHVVAYEDGDAELLGQLRAGYPRFFVPRLVRDLAAEAGKQLRLDAASRCTLYPNERSAERCAAYIRARAAARGVDVRPAWGGRAFAVAYPADVAAAADEYWRYAGEGVSGRQASVLLGGSAAADPGRAERAIDEIKRRLAANSGQHCDDVFLFPSGMAGVAAVHRAVGAIGRGRKTVQFDFPYVDVLRVQKEFGEGVEFFPAGDASELARLEAMLSNGDRPAAIYCEMPSNPLLRCVDLGAIGALARTHGIPLVVDDTVATQLNIDAFLAADLVTTSLTKYFSGVGDVLAGCVMVNAKSPLADALRAALRAQTDTPLGGEDAIVLEENSQDFRERMDVVNATAPKLVEWLQQQPAVAEVYYPTTQTPEHYAAIRKPGGGYSGLFSILLEDPERNAPAFYDGLHCSKGPSLGTNFSLACPYTLLAHYHELDWCERFGVSRWLIRFSTGLEPFEELQTRFADALSALAR